MQNFLDTVPSESTGKKIKDGMVITLPLPEGGYGRFKILESPIMEEGLANQFPEIKTFIVQGVDDPASSGRIDQTPKGFRACIYSPRGRFFIDPYWKENDSVSMSYYTRDYLNPAKLKELACGVLGNNSPVALRTASLGVAERPTGTVLKIYRLALACTGEYAAAVATTPVTVSKVMAAMVTSVNRVNSVYEKDFSIRMIMVSNNASLIFTNAATDPYTNTDGAAMLTQNQTKVDAVIGSANYDIGHVFSTGGGGIAGLGVVCLSGQKAQGVTGSPNPVGDPFDIDYVAHEMGHQFGGNHTFNGTTGSASGNRNASTAYEPGSGSTVMAYAGICAPQDLQSNSDPYFHSGSYTEIDNYTTTGTGKASFSTNSTGNTPPVIAALPSATFSIPSQTPFALTASATDADGDTLTYCWEQFDAGSAQDPTANPRDNGSSCIFRSYNPSTNPTRVFPSLPFILANSNLPPVFYTNNGTTYINGETIPTTTRTMNFRVSVRDNRAGGGGQNWAAMKVATVSTAGPFRITSLNTPANLTAGVPLTLSWNVAGTTASPISCANVKISYSTDGGTNFPVILAASVPNNGSAVVTIPSVPANATSQGRFKIEAVGNLFFDISDANLVVTATSSAPTLASFSPTSGFANTRVILTGTDFSSASSVTFNGVPAFFTIDSNTQITAKVPANAGTGIIQVQNSIGATSSITPFTFNDGPPAPEISGFSPIYGIGGSSVTVTGTGFTNVLSVKLAESNITDYTLDSPTQITLTVPNGSNSGPISVTTSSGTFASTNSFIVLQGDGVPILSGFTPSSGSPGSLVTIAGNNFYGVTTVLFNGQNASFTIDSPTQITATVPSSATTGLVTVVNTFGTGASLSTFGVNPILLSEDFVSITGGNDTSTSGSSTVWTGNTNFTTVSTAYQAGGAVRLGSGNAVGSLTSRALDLSGNGGNFSVRFDVKGWTAVEGLIKVTAGSLTPQTVSYSAVMASSSYETKTLNFTGGQANSTVKIETTSKRAFIDNVQILSGASVASPVIYSPLTATGTVNSSFSYAIQASNTPTSFGASGLPAGLTNNAATGVISGTPTVAGTNNVTITASNAGGTDTETLVLTVNPAPTPPVISSALTASAVLNSAFNYQISASGNPTSYGASGLPAGLTNNANTGAISGTPTAMGTFNVTISATNGAGTGSATLVLTVASAANAPVITSAGSATGTVGTALIYQITASNNPTSYTATGLPAGLTNNPSTGLISGTPTVAGTSLVNLSASNSGGTGSATLLLTINPSGGGGSSSGILTSWDTTGLSTSNTWAPVTNNATNVNANLTMTTQLTRGSSILASGTGVSNAIGGSGGWGTTPADTNSWIFAFRANTGYSVSVTNLSGYTRKSGTGPSNVIVDVSVNGGAYTNAGSFPTTSGSGTGSSFALALTNVSALQNVAAGQIIKFRICPTGTSGSWYLLNGTNALQVSGTVLSPIPAPALAASSLTNGATNVYGAATSNPPSFTLTGSNLAGNVILSASAEFEISQTAGGGSGYALTQTLVPTGTTISNVVYVRLVASNLVGNYSGSILANTTNSAGLTVTIPTNTVTKKDISVTGLTALDKIYDGTNTASITGLAVYASLVNGESFSVSGNPVAAFADANVGSGKTVTVTGYNAPSPNYNVLPTTLNASITTKSVAISGVVATNKVYDGTLAAGLSGIPQFTDVLVSDAGNVSVGGTPVAVFTSANVGNDIPVTVSGYTLSGTAAGNYWPVQPSGLSASINPKTATIRANDQSKLKGAELLLGVSQTKFTSSGLVLGEQIGTVTLTANGGTATNAPAGSYLITPSDPVAPRTIPQNAFQAANYAFTFVDGTLTVVDAVTLSDWATQKGLTGDNALPSADPDGDGMSNLMEFFLGLDPTQSGGASGPVMTITNGPSNTLTMTYRRAKGVTGISSGVQTIGDLSNTNWGTNGVQETVVDKGAYEEVTATVTNAPGETRKFMRLKVSQP